MNEDLRHAITYIGQTLLAFWICFVLALCVAFAMGAGWFDFSAGNEGGLSGGHTEAASRFELKVASDGRTIYTEAENVGLEIRRAIMGKVYPSPEAAVAATSPELPGNPAYAHAVNLCYHGTGKVSNSTGNSRHLTWFVKHENNRHYTKTAHQVLSNYVWVTTDVYAYDVSRSYCGC